MTQLRNVFFFVLSLMFVFAIGCNESSSPTDGTPMEPIVDDVIPLPGTRDPDPVIEVPETLQCEGGILAGEIGGGCRLGDQHLCNGDLFCVPEFDNNMGGPGSPIINHPDGDNAVIEATLFPGEYCSMILTSDNFECSDADNAACAENCGVCTPFFSDANICLRACEPNFNDNSTCRPGYQCTLAEGGCDTGCQSDDECRVARQDTNNSGGLDVNDQFVYDVNSTAYCDTNTYRCVKPGDPAAAAGDTCTADSQCEDDGLCISQASYGFPGGYCSKFYCDVPGNECANGGVCNERAFRNCALRRSLHGRRRRRCG
ncbi:MAG: hypothetical protein R3A47_07300 [Polyangiales bacterium]